MIDEKIPQPLIFQNFKRYPALLNNIKRISLNEVSKVLGLTVDFLFLDLREDFSPNKIIILLETVRGGGVIFVLGLPYSKWGYSVNQRRFLMKKGSYLLDWFLENVQNNSQCITHKFKFSEVIARFNPMPYNTNLTTQINNIHVTPDQKNAVEGVVNIVLDSKHPNSCSILIANRGRGKSASVGLTISQVISKRVKPSFNVIVSSPHPKNVQTLFGFLSKGLTSEGIKFRQIQDGEWVSEIRAAPRIKITYIWPSEINRNLKTDLFVVDEAAAIPVEILNEILRIKAKKIFVSTVHGYEGAGRGFTHKFLSKLRKQKLIHYKEFSLEQPIRYMQDDSIEKLLNDSFFLDIEIKPSIIDYQTLNKEIITLREYQDPGYLFSKTGLPYFKQLFGLLVYAHYRNQPNDLLLLADSAKHFLVGVYGADKQNNEFLLVSNQLAREGEMTEQEIQTVTSGEFIEGNLIPTVAIRHFSTNFAKLRGLRIVRIAAHPSLINKGVGRVAMEQQAQIFTSYDWIGVSFGATVKLMKFWMKFGFKSVHIRPTKTPETGEWNIVVIHPVSASARTIVNQASADFLLQFISLLKQSLHSMVPDLALQILKSCAHIPDYQPRITSSGKIRLNNYLNGNLNFLLTVDVIYELATKYFVSPNEIKLSSSQEALLITRVIQGRTWSQTLARTGLNWKAANGLLAKAIAKISQHYFSITTD